MYIDVVTKMMGGDDVSGCFYNRERLTNLVDNMLAVMGPSKARNEFVTKTRYNPSYDKYKDVPVWDLINKTGIVAKLYVKQDIDNGGMLYRVIGMAEGATMVFGEGSTIREAVVTAVYLLLSNIKFSMRVQKAIEELVDIKPVVVKADCDHIPNMLIAPKTIIDNKFLDNYGESVKCLGGKYYAEVSVLHYRFTAEDTNKKTALFKAFKQAVHTLCLDGEINLSEECGDRDEMGLSTAQAVVSTIDAGNYAMIGAQDSKAVMIKERKDQIMNYLSLVGIKSVYDICGSFSVRDNIDLYMTLDFVKKRFKHHDDFNIVSYDLVDLVAVLKPDGID